MLGHTGGGWDFLDRPLVPLVVVLPQAEIGDTKQVMGVHQDERKGARRFAVTVHGSRTKSEIAFKRSEEVFEPSEGAGDVPDLKGISCSMAGVANVGSLTLFLAHS